MADKKNEFSLQKKEFAVWLSRKYSSVTCREILNSLQTLEKICVKWGTVKNSFWETEPTKLKNDVSSFIDRDTFFRVIYGRRSEQMKNALECFVSFMVETKDVKQKVSSTKLTDKKNTPVVQIDLPVAVTQKPVDMIAQEEKVEVIPEEETQPLLKSQMEEVNAGSKLDGAAQEAVEISTEQSDTLTAEELAVEIAEDSCSEVELSVQLEAFKKWLERNKNFQKKRARRYANTIYEIEQFQKEHKLANQTFSGMDVERLRAASKELMNNEDFIAYNRQCQFRLSITIKFFVEFVKANPCRYLDDAKKELALSVQMKEMEQNIVSTSVETSSEVKSNKVELASIELSEVKETKKDSVEQVDVEADIAAWPLENGEWTIAEKVLLVQLYLECKSKSNGYKKNRIQEFSEMLRKAAKTSGLEIDEKYRNIAGITIQYKLIENIMENGSNWALSHSKTSSKACALLKSNVSVFNALADGLTQKIAQASENPIVTIKGKSVLQSLPGETTGDGAQIPVDPRIQMTLNLHYVYGFNIASSIELYRFRNNFLKDHDEECIYSDEELVTQIEEVGVNFSGKIYVVEQEVVQKIVQLMNNLLQQGVSIIYFEKFYELNEEWLYDGHIISVEVLREVLKKSFNAYYSKSNYMILSENKSTEINALLADVARVWGDEILRTFAELAAAVPFIPLDKIKRALSCGEQYYWNSFETYANKDLFLVADEQIKRIEEFVFEVCDKKGSVQVQELPLSEISFENYKLTETALYDIVFSFLKESFAKNGNVIMRKEESVDTITALAQYCKTRETCNMETLKDIMKEAIGRVHYPTIIEAANDLMVRIDYDNFVADNKVVFDVNTIDEVLDYIVLENGIGLKEVTTFSAFPYCGYSWNYFLLESYCRRFSERYKYVCIVANSKNAGALISKKNKMNFHSIMANAIAKSTIQINEKEVFDFLIASGFMIRRRYADIDGLLEQATVLREGRK